MDWDDVIAITKEKQTRNGLRLLLASYRDFDDF